MPMLFFGTKSKYSLLSQRVKKYECGQETSINSIYIGLFVLYYFKFVTLFDILSWNASKYIYIQIYHSCKTHKTSLIYGQFIQKKSRIKRLKCLSRKLRSELLRKKITFHYGRWTCAFQTTYNFLTPLVLLKNGQKCLVDIFLLQHV
jgi:hypothetical protein